MSQTIVECEFFSFFMDPKELEKYHWRGETVTKNMIQNARSKVIVRDHDPRNICHCLTPSFFAQPTEHPIHRSLSSYMKLNLLE